MTHEFIDLKGFLFLVLIYIPRTLSTSIDCGGKPFHCLNSTHFMICVDLGGGVSSTIDDFIIPCPPTTVCQKENRFECEFPKIEEPVSPVNVITAIKDSEKSASTENSLTTIITVTKTVPLPEKALAVLPITEKPFSSNNEILENLKDEFTGGNEKYFDDDIVPLINAMNVSKTTGEINIFKPKADEIATQNNSYHNGVNISEIDILVSNENSTLNEMLIFDNNTSNTVKKKDNNLSLSVNDSELTTLSSQYINKSSSNKDQGLVNTSVNGQTAHFYNAQNLSKSNSASVTDMTDDTLNSTQAILATTSAYNDTNENGNDVITSESVMNHSFALKVASENTNYMTETSIGSGNKDYTNTHEPVTPSQVYTTESLTESFVTGVPNLEETSQDAVLIILNNHDAGDNFNTTDQISLNDNNGTVETIIEMTTVQTNFITEETYSINHVPVNLSEIVNVSLPLQGVKSYMTIDVTTTTMPIFGTNSNLEKSTNVNNIIAFSSMDNTSLSFEASNSVTKNLTDELNTEDIINTLGPTSSTTEITSTSFPKKTSKIDQTAFEDTVSFSDGLTINAHITQPKLDETKQVDQIYNQENQTQHSISKLNKIYDKIYTTHHDLANKDDFALQQVYSQASIQGHLSNKTLDIIGSTEPHFATTMKYNGVDNYVNDAFGAKFNESTTLKVNNDVPESAVQAYKEPVKKYNETINIFEPLMISSLAQTSASIQSKLNTNVTELNTSPTDDIMRTTKKLLENMLELTTVVPKLNAKNDTHYEDAEHILDNLNLQTTIENAAKIGSTTVTTANSPILNNISGRAEYVTERLKTNEKGNEIESTVTASPIDQTTANYYTTHYHELQTKNATVSMSSSAIEHETQPTLESTPATAFNTLMSNFTGNTGIIKNNRNNELSNKNESKVEMASHGLNDSKIDNDIRIKYNQLSNSSTINQESIYNETFTIHSQISKTETTTFPTSVKDNETIFVNESLSISSTDKPLFYKGDNLKSDSYLEVNKESVSNSSINEETTIIAETSKHSIDTIPKMVLDSNETVLKKAHVIQDDLNQTVSNTYLSSNLQAESNSSLSAIPANNLDIKNDSILNVTHLPSFEIESNYSNGSSSNGIIGRTESDVAEETTIADKKYTIFRDVQNKTNEAFSLSANQSLKHTNVNQSNSDAGETDHVNVEASQTLKQITKQMDTVLSAKDVVIPIIENITSTANTTTTESSPIFVNTNHTIGKDVAGSSFTIKKILSSSKFTPIPVITAIQHDNKPVFNGSETKNILTEQSGYVSLIPFKDADLNLRNESITSIINTVKQNTLSKINPLIFDGIPSSEIPLFTTAPPATFSENNLDEYGENNKTSETPISSINLTIVNSTAYPLPVKKFNESNPNITALATEYVQVPRLLSVNVSNKIAMSHTDITILQSTSTSTLPTPDTTVFLGVDSTVTQILDSTLKSFIEPNIIGVQTEVVSKNVTQKSEQFIITGLNSTLTVMKPSKVSIQNQTNAMVDQVSATIPVTETRNNDSVNIGKKSISPQSVQELIMNYPDPSSLLTAPESTTENEVIVTTNTVLQSTISASHLVNVTVKDQLIINNNLNTSSLILNTGINPRSNNSVSQILHPLLSRQSSNNVKLTNNSNTQNYTLPEPNMTTTVRQNIETQIQPAVVVLIGEVKTEDLVQNYTHIFDANVTQNYLQGGVPISKKAIVNQFQQVDLLSETKTENSINTGKQFMSPQIAQSTQEAVSSDSDDKLTIQTSGKDVIKNSTSKDQLVEAATRVKSSNNTKSIKQTLVYDKANTGSLLSRNKSTSVKRSAIKPNKNLYGETSSLEEQNLDTVTDDATKIISSNITKDVQPNLNDSSSLTSIILQTESATMVENVNDTHTVVQKTILSDIIVSDISLNNAESESEKYDGAEQMTNLEETRNSTVNLPSSDINKREEINLSYINDTVSESQINIEISGLASHNESSKENNTESVPIMNVTPSGTPAYNNSESYKSQLNGMNVAKEFKSPNSSASTRFTTYLNNSGYISNFKNSSINKLLQHKEQITLGNNTAIKRLSAKENNITTNKNVFSGQQIQSFSSSEEPQNNVSAGLIKTTRILNKLNYTLTPGIAKRTVNANKVSTFKVDCLKLPRGKYADNKDCRKFYICLGKLNPIVGRCPNNTVFSEINKQCTRNLSHCVRNNQFHCLYEGRFTDVLRDNIYYICVKNNLHGFYRYKLQCQDGYRLNKSTVKCEKKLEEYVSQSAISLSMNSNDRSIKKTVASENSESIEFECKKEGKFPIPNDCRKYYVCSKNSKDEYRRKIKKCTKDEVYDKKKKKCVLAESEEC